MKRKLTCIRCPLGCSMEAEKNENELISLSGNKCKRGQEYARQELFNPERIVTTTVAAEHETITHIPVRTDKPVPRDLVFQVLSEVSAITVKPPLKRGSVIVPSVAGTNANVITSRPLD
ncbi:MAG: DUF1667 domain-containing protein [Spirochaetia bacterium]